MPDSCSGITRELVFTNKRKAIIAARALLKALPADWKPNTGDHLLYVEADEVTVNGITGEGFRRIVVMKQEGQTGALVRAFDLESSAFVVPFPTTAGSPFLCFFRQERTIE